ncbi:MAG: PAQR family membrane homeostasis protein TrhA [Salibacteraceae bacterium]
MNKENTFNYHPREELINVWSHAIGFVLAVVGSVFLLNKALGSENIWGVISSIVFSVSMMMLYLASSSYHFSSKESTRRYLRVFDHASIYLLIAGTYTPFTLVSLHGKIGCTLFGITWLMAVCGVILKLFYTGKYNILSTVMYVIMGWNIVFAIEPLIVAISLQGFYWLLAGGIIYSVGAVLFMFDKIRYTHAIFHLFVLAGTICHFFAVYLYVL